VVKTRFALHQVVHSVVCSYGKAVRLIDVTGKSRVSINEAADTLVVVVVVVVVVVIGWAFVAMVVCVLRWRCFLLW
jgi:hypothetical protein